MSELSAFISGFLLGCMCVGFGTLVKLGAVERAIKRLMPDEQTVDERLEKEENLSDGLHQKLYEAREKIRWAMAILTAEEPPRPQQDSEGKWHATISTNSVEGDCVVATVRDERGNVR